MNISNFNLILTPDNNFTCHFSKGISILVEESKRQETTFQIRKGRYLRTRKHSDACQITPYPTYTFLTVCSIKLYQYLFMALSTHTHSNKLMFPSQLTHLAVKASSHANALAGSHDLSLKKAHFHSNKQKGAVCPPLPNVVAQVKQM